MSETIKNDEERNYEIAWEIAHRTNDAHDTREEAEETLEILKEMRIEPGISIEPYVLDKYDDIVGRENATIDSMEEMADQLLPDVADAAESFEDA